MQSCLKTYKNMNFVYSQIWPNIPCPSCYRLFEFIYWNQIPTELEGVGFERWLGYEGEALMNGISVLTNETPETLLSFHHMRTQQENIVYNQKGDSHQTLDLPAPCSWIFLSPDLWEIKICCHRHPVYGNFVIAAKFDQDQSCDGVVVVFL